VTALAPTLQAFFTDRLLGQRAASPNTIAAYRTSLLLLVRYASDRTGNRPAQLDIEELDAPLVAAFLDHLETDRENTARTRNNRLAAIHSLFSYAALRHPEHAASIQRVLAIPPKRYQRNLVTYLSDEEVDAFLAACDQTTWTGRRDHALFVVAIQTGLRISELIALNRGDITLSPAANLHTVGKGRKERRTPLVSHTVKVLRAWLTERDGTDSDPLFPTATGRRLSRDAIEHRIALYTDLASKHCPTLATKHVTAHTLRHTCAMRLLLEGADIAVIALWLGHSQTSSTDMYIHADMRQKEQAIAKVRPPSTKPGRYRATDALLVFLESL
jgi:site-specific recombinase XerD